MKLLIRNLTIAVCPSGLFWASPRTSQRHRGKMPKEMPSKLRQQEIQVPQVRVMLASATRAWSLIARLGRRIPQHIPTQKTPLSHRRQVRTILPNKAPQQLQRCWRECLLAPARRYKTATQMAEISVCMEPSRDRFVDWESPHRPGSHR
jgi:hypothetical protein